jgi:hypothetical protein
MRLPPSVPPRLAALLCAGLVCGAWVIPFLPGPLSHISQTWPILVALPWSLFLIQSGIFDGPFGLLLTFLAGMLNGALLYIMLVALQRLPRLRRRQLLLPPAA